MARPTKPDAEKKTLLPVYATGEQKEEIKKLAEAARMEVSPFIVHKILTKK